MVDEAHKLPDAARQMYTETLSPHNMVNCANNRRTTDFARMQAFLTLTFSRTQGLSLRRKSGELGYTPRLHG